MRINEIKVGDILSVKGKTVEVEVVDNIYDEISYFDGEAEGYLDVDIKKVSPIELTADILRNLGFSSEEVWAGVLEFKFGVYGHDDIEYDSLKFSTNVTVTVAVDKPSGKVRSIEVYAFTDKGCTSARYMKAVEPHYLHELIHILDDIGYIDSFKDALRRMV